MHSGSEARRKTASGKKIAPQSIKVRDMKILFHN